MYKKIFVPVDDSKTSLQALREACSLAKNLGAALHIVHVVDLALFSWGGTGYLQSGEVRAAAADAGRKVLDDAQKIVAEFSLTASEEILECTGQKIPALLADAVKANGCDLVVMGTHGFSGVMHLLMGSVAEGVLRQVEVPVLLVRKIAE